MPASPDFIRMLRAQLQVNRGQIGTHGTNMYPYFYQVVYKTGIEYLSINAAIA